MGASIVVDAVSLRPKENTLCPLCLCGELSCAKLGIQEISTKIDTPDSLALANK